MLFSVFFLPALYDLYVLYWVYIVCIYKIVGNCFWPTYDVNFPVIGETGFLLLVVDLVRLHVGS